MTTPASLFSTSPKSCLSTKMRSRAPIRLQILPWRYPGIFIGTILPRTNSDGKPASGSVKYSSAVSRASSVAMILIAIRRNAAANWSILTFYYTANGSSCSPTRRPSQHAMRFSLTSASAATHPTACCCRRPSTGHRRGRTHWRRAAASMACRLALASFAIGRVPDVVAIAALLVIAFHDPQPAVPNGDVVILPCVPRRVGQVLFPVYAVGRAPNVVVKIPLGRRRRVVRSAAENPDAVLDAPRCRRSCRAASSTAPRA